MAFISLSKGGVIKTAIIFILVSGFFIYSLLAWSKPIAAETAPGFKIGDRVSVTVNALRVRPLPSVKAAKIGVQKYKAYGIIVEGPKTADNYIWWKINYDNWVDGWSAGKYLKLEKPVVLGMSKDFGTEGTKFKVGDKVAVSFKYLAVRKSPTTASVRLRYQLFNAGGVILEGPKAANGYTWWKIDYNKGADGWSADKYLKLIAAAPTPTATISPAANITSGGETAADATALGANALSASPSSKTSNSGPGSSGKSGSKPGKGSGSGSGSGTTPTPPVATTTPPVATTTPPVATTTPPVATTTPPVATTTPPVATTTPPVATSTLSGLTQVAGWRTSDYGTEDPTAVAQKDSAYYVSVALKMAAKLGARPGGVYTVGYIETDTTMLPYELGQAAAGIASVHIDDAGVQASPETMLKAFDAAGLDIILVVEPGKANVTQLATAILNKYKNHPSVKGFGVDNEWYMSENGTMSAATAVALRDAVRAVNPNYKTLIKHFYSYKLPKGIAGITYLTDTCGYSSKTAAINDYAAWANTFAGSEIGYQFGYDKLECGTPDDSLWWKPMGTGGEPALLLAQAIKAKVPTANIYSIYWADFTILTQFPK